MWDQFYSDTQILCEFTPDINAGSPTEAPVLEDIGQHTVYVFLIAYSWLHALVEKALYGFNTLDLTQVRFMPSFFWICFPTLLYITNKEIF